MGATSGSTYEEIQAQRFGVDLVLPGIGQAVQPTAAGDWPIQSGRANLLDAHVRRAVAAPGQMVHRGLYGGGLPLFVEALGDPATLARAEIGIRQNALRDVRVGEVVTTSNLGGPGGTNRAGTTTIELEIQPRGEDTTETATLVV